jgi:hypothetical protein
VENGHGHTFVGIIEILTAPLVWGFALIEARAGSLFFLGHHLRDGIGYHISSLVQNGLGRWSGSGGLGDVRSLCSPVGFLHGLTTPAQLTRVSTYSFSSFFDLALTHLGDSCLTELICDSDTSSFSSYISFDPIPSIYILSSLVVAVRDNVPSRCISIILVDLL